jgi:glycosyltransferase involved in cell wall biosynthesis
MPRILFNTTTLHKGGAMQSSVNFLNTILQKPTEFEWHFALSEAVVNEIQKANGSLPNNVEVFPVSPARDKKSRTRLFDFAQRVQPDAVFTFMGPAYVKFSQPHLLGCCEPWVSHAGLTAYRALDFPFEWLKFWLLTKYKRHWFRKAECWVTETENARQGISRNLSVPLDKVHIVSNSCGAGYFEQVESAQPFPKSEQKIRIFCFSAFYKHKNLSILPVIAAELKKLRPNLDFEIVLTLPANSDWKEIESRAKKLNVAEHIVNQGPVPIAQGPTVYQTCDLVLLPTLLETFSATYPEAMAMGLPIVTSDLDFARDTCGDAALFFPPRNARAGVDAIVRLLDDRTLWNDLIAKGKQRLKDFPTPQERYELYLDLIRKLLATV